MLDAIKVIRDEQELEVSFGTVMVTGWEVLLSAQGFVHLSKLNCRQWFVA
jgi:hypothetical protein